MSQLKVDSIVPRGGLLSGASGGIIQIVQALKTDAFSTTSTSFVDITGMSLTITPQSSNSKILIDVCINHGADQIGGLRVLRGSTPVGISTAVSGSNQVNASFGAHRTNNITTNYVGCKFFDSPATTSETTYKLQVFMDNHLSLNAQIFNLNKPENPDNLNQPRIVGTISSITAYEVSG